MASSTTARPAMTTRSSSSAVRQAIVASSTSSSSSPTASSRSNSNASSSTPPRQSPTKRAITNVSPTSSSQIASSNVNGDGNQGDPNEERVLRQKLSTASFNDGPSSSPSPSSPSLPSLVATATATTSKLTSPVMVEDEQTPLGSERIPFELNETSSTPVVDQPATLSSSAIDANDLSALDGTPQTHVAQQQTMHFAEIPHELHQALARLSSQHVLSEYNVLKRTIASAPTLQATLSPSCPSAPLQRSFSSPAATSSAPLAPSSYAWPSSLAASSAVDADRAAPSERITTPTAPVRPEVTRATSAWPTSQRGQQQSSKQVGRTPTRRTSDPFAKTTEATMLTPTLASLAFCPAEDLVGPKIQRVATPVAIPDPKESRLDSSIVERANEESVPAVPSMPTGITADGLLPGMKIINGVAVKTSVSHPMNISALIPPEAISSLASSIFGGLQSPLKPRTPLTPSVSILVNSSSSDHKPFILESPLDGDLWEIAFNNPRSMQPTNGSALGLVSTDARLGNFMLSSCPGKKVRMDPAPVTGGRSAICRDVKTDLSRAKNEGVGLVVCCLDDTELAFLGAPWDEYSRACSELGLSIIRIPMVEGFAPSSPAALDAQLARIIRDHTLRGESVLAHCRGGIGRAGLVACCWMLKMGLIGGGEDGYDAEPMRIVERVIEVIRKRRSVKSIETPIQVSFLLQYVVYLQHEAAIVRAHDL